MAKSNKLLIIGIFFGILFMIACIFANIIGQNIANDWSKAEKCKPEALRQDIISLDREKYSEKQINAIIEYKKEIIGCD